MSAALGAWLMAAPAIFHTQGSAAHSNHILGALVVTVSIIAFAEPLRAARFINNVLALGIIVLPWLVGGGAVILIAGILITVLSIPPGKIKNNYAEWNPLIV